MALKQPLFMENNTTSQNADEVRLLVKGLLGGVTGSVGGVGGATHFKVTEKSGTPNMSVDVAPGHIFIEGSRNSAQGTYHLYNDATVNVALSASDPTNPRIDIIYVRVRDSAYDAGFTGDDDAEIVVAEGTPAAVPVAPTITDEDYVELARVTVGANVSAIEDADIVDTRVPSPAWTRPRGFIDRAVASGLDQANITTEAAVSGCSITFDAKAGRRYKVTGYSLIIYTTSGQNALGEIKSSVGGTHYGRYGQHRAAANNSTTLFYASTVIDFPSDGSQTVMLTALVSSGGGSITIGNSSMPAWIMVEDIGGFLT